MTREEALKTLKENLCGMCTCGSPYMESCDIRDCDSRNAINVLSAEPCDDCISRADTIEWLKKVTVTDGITFETGFKQILTDIQNMPPVTPKQKMGRWIPVSERLPEDFQRVLVTIVNYNEDRVVRVAEYHHWKGEFQILENHERWEIGEKGLLAWMPLPEPYKAESED